MAKYKSEAKKQKQAIKRAEYKAGRNAKYKEQKKQELREAERSQTRTREIVSERIEGGIRVRFGLPDDCVVFRVPQFGKRSIREVSRGTVVLVNLAANKLICVARFNLEVNQYLSRYY